LNRSSVSSPNQGAAEPLLKGQSLALKAYEQIVPHDSGRTPLTHPAVSPPHGGAAPTVEPAATTTAPVGATSRGLYDGLKPQRLANLLACAPGNVISKRELAELLFGDAPSEDEGLYLRQLVYKLRKAGYRIESFHGYRLVSAP
jgi:hypothetical protein